MIQDAIYNEAIRERDQLRARLERLDGARGRMRAVLAAHGRVPHDLIDQVLDELEHAIHEGEHQ